MTDPASWTLGLMRHAKSDWGDAELRDHDRPLNARGRAAAPAMAQWMAEQGFLPKLILASTAVRVQQTVEGLLTVWTHEPSVVQVAELYSASADTIARRLVDDAWTAFGTRPASVLIVAHNPGMGELISVLRGEITRVPTATVALFRCRPLDESGGRRPRVQCCLGVGRPKEID